MGHLEETGGEVESQNSRCVQGVSVISSMPGQWAVQDLFVVKSEEMGTMAQLAILHVWHQKSVAVALPLALKYQELYASQHKF